VLEDAQTGVTSAEAAGCVVVAVPSVTPIELAPGRHVVASLRSVTADWLLGLVA
jgi:beta-phosphoglucomutase-like phosphatase (HAD superfamily)